MSATTTPYDEDVIVEIEVPTRRICGLSARSCASLTGTTSKNGNCLHCEAYQRADSQEVGRRGLLLARRWSTLLQSVWKALRAKASVARLGRALRAGNTALGIDPEIPTPNLTADHRRQLTHRKTPTSPQHTHGILWSPQVAYTRKCKAFVMLIALVVTCQFASLILTQFPFFSHRFSGRCGLSLQLAASLTSSSPRHKTLEFAVSCLTHPKPVRKLSQLTPRALFSHPLAEGFRNDPRNPYAAQIAKEEHH